MAQYLLCQRRAIRIKQEADLSLQACSIWSHPNVDPMNLGFVLQPGIKQRIYRILNGSRPANIHQHRLVLEYLLRIQVGKQRIGLLAGMWANSIQVPLDHGSDVMGSQPSSLALKIKQILPELLQLRIPEHVEYGLGRG